jgi:hypothetical protein
LIRLILFWGVVSSFLSSLSFFSSLDGRKEAKEDQGVRDASQV